MSLEKLTRTIGANPRFILPAGALFCTAVLFIITGRVGLSPILPNILLLVGSIAILMFSKPITALYLLLILSLLQNILGPWFESFYVGTWRDILTVGILALIFLKYTIARKGFRARTPVTGLLLLFSALIFVQIFNPQLPSVGMGIFGFRAYFVPILGLFIGLNFISSTKELKRIGLLLLVFLTLSAIVGIIQSKMGFSSYENLSQYIRTDMAHQASGYSWYRVSSIFGSVWEFGNLMTFMILLSLPLYHIVRRKRAKTFLFITIAILFTGLITSAALSSIYSAILGICIYAVLLKKRKLSFVVASVILIALSAIFMERIGWERVVFYFISERQHTTLLAAVPFHEALLGNLKSNFFGSGMGISLDSIGIRYGLPISMYKHMYPDLDMEGDYFRLMNQAGLPTMLLFIFIHVKTILWGLKIRNLLSDVFLKSIALGISILLISALVTSMFRTYIGQRPLDLFIWISIGILFALPRLEKREARSVPERRYPDPGPGGFAGRS